MNEMNFIISDEESKQNNLKYILDSTLDCVKKLNGKAKTETAGGRALLKISVPSEYSEIYSQILVDKIADVIAVNYKYVFFKKYVRTSGISEVDYEMLLAALIAADLDEDKRYVINSKPTFTDFTVDGYFNFRLRPLTEKWSEIVTYIPTYFSSEKLREFISYIICEKKRRRAVVYGGKVYDERYNRMLKSSLVDKIKEGSLTREIILSGFSEVELSGRLPEIEEKYLTAFYGDKIFFKKEKIT